jgi:hypothetical protein
MWIAAKVRFSEVSATFLDVVNGISFLGLAGRTKPEPVSLE